MEPNENPNTEPGGGKRNSPPRDLPTIEAEVYGDDILLEEETFSWFDPEKWYPVRLGEMIHSRYQVLVKLGFGSVSTVWLCRDLRLVCNSFPNHILDPQNNLVLKQSYLRDAQCVRDRPASSTKRNSDIRPPKISCQRNAAPRRSKPHPDPTRLF